MNGSNNRTDDDTLSIKEIQNAASEETQNVMRAADLRLRELTSLSSKYTAGELSPREATDQYMRHLDKWGDPFPGVSKAVGNLSDEQIHEEMEKSLAGHAARVQTTKKPLGRA